MRKLIDLKQTVGEKYLHRKDVELNDWIVGMLAFAESSKHDLGVNNNGMHLLDEFFLKKMYDETDN